MRIGQKTDFFLAASEMSEISPNFLKAKQQAISSRWSWSRLFPAENSPHALRELIKLQILKAQIRIKSAKSFYFWSQ